jgi:hypothetical protein
MNKLLSEQLPNDGGYHVKRLLKEVNDRLKKYGKQGKRAIIVAKKTSLSLQFTFHDGNGRPQKNVGLGAIPLSVNGILEAEKIAQMVTNQLMAGTFTWDWFNGLIGKDTSEQNKQLTCVEIIESYKKHYYKQRQGNKNIDYSWYCDCRYIEETFKDKNCPLSLSIIRQTIDSTKNNSDPRSRVLNGLVGLLKFIGNSADCLTHLEKTKPQSI